MPAERRKPARVSEPCLIRLAANSLIALPFQLVLIERVTVPSKSVITIKYKNKAIENDTHIGSGRSTRILFTLLDTPISPLEFSTPSTNSLP